MRTTAHPSHKVADLDEAAERGHAAWKRAKVARGLAEAEDRETLIPAEQVWRELGLER